MSKQLFVDGDTQSAFCKGRLMDGALASRRERRHEGATRTPQKCLGLNIKLHCGSSLRWRCRLHEVDADSVQASSQRRATRRMPTALLRLVTASTTILCTGRRKIRGQQLERAGLHRTPAHKESAGEHPLLHYWHWDSAKSGVV